MMTGVMRAAFIGCHTLALLAIKGVVKKHRRYADFLRVKLIKYIMRIKCAVIIANTCMVSSDNKMRAAVVFSYEGMKDCFFGSSISHCSRIDNKRNPVLWEIILQQRLVALHPYGGRHIITLGLANNWVNHKGKEVLLENYYPK